ncbi:uncharacterized protein LOC113335771 [Papaver somniferum]|uniref:uncharacterized protein LOC113335771 n=1 Tax=Papaver somniferum TaxID=3469 RepID=UPI000E6FDE30|nr:uncharacterized protein LOC113335771 [Papaver somniferum]
MFLDYQEGKPFVSENDSLNVVSNSQVIKVTNTEVKDFNWITQNFSNKCQFTSYIFQLLKGFSRLQVSQIIYVCVVISSPDSVRMIFYRGREFVVCEMVLMCASRKKCSYCVFIFAGRVIDRGKWFDLSWNTSYYVDSKLRYSLELLSSYSGVLVSVGNGDNEYSWQLFLKLSQEDCITSYACGRLLFDRYRMHQTDLWNSYLEVLVAASSELFQKLLNYMGSNNYDLVQLNASSYFGAAVVLVKASQGDSEDRNTLVADISHSMVTKKMRYGFLKMFVSVMCSLSSGKCIYGGQYFSGRVFDRGRGTRSIVSNSTLCLQILTFGMFVLTG